MHAIYPYIEALARELSTEDHRWRARDNEHDNPRYAELESEQTGLRLACSYDNQECTRIGLRAIGPRDPKGDEVYIRDLGPTRITIAVDRDAARAAADIRRRLVDSWLKVWPTITAKANSELVNWDQCQGLLQEMASMVGNGDVRQPGRYDRTHKAFMRLPGSDHARYVHPEIEASVWRADTVSLKLDDMPAELAKKVVALVVSELVPRKT